MAPVLVDAQVVLSTRANHRSIWAKGTGGRLVEASIRTTSRVEASIGAPSKGRGSMGLPRMTDLGHQTRGQVGLLKDTITVKGDKIKSYLDREVIVRAEVE